jgi:hypothetical protein
VTQSTVSGCVDRRTGGSVVRRDMAQEKKRRIPRPTQERIAACESHLFFLHEDLKLFPQQYDRYKHLKDDPAKEAIAASYSAPGVLSEAAHKTGRAKADFELSEISREEYERFKARGI